MAGRGAALTFSRRLISVESTATGVELRAALRCLSLADEASDTEIKNRYLEVVKRSHPDVVGNWEKRHGKESASSGGTINKDKSGDKIQQVVEAYQLLRRFSDAERRLILRQGREGSCDEAVKGRGRRIYEGRPRASPRDCGHSRTAEFNKSYEEWTRRPGERQRENVRDKSPPWRVGDTGRARFRGSTLLLRALWPLGSGAQAARERIGSQYKCTSTTPEKWNGDDADRVGSHWKSYLQSRNEFMAGCSEETAGEEKRRVKLEEYAKKASLVDAAYGFYITVGILLFIAAIAILLILSTVARWRKARHQYMLAVETTSNEKEITSQ
ncbi:hypothetical protein ERJ75_000752800 [Trypanosoma vivax]|nr:hypothetical protein ERJ75_000752800 [Trypanosoma vivax]